MFYCENKLQHEVDDRLRVIAEMETCLNDIILPKQLIPSKARLLAGSYF